MPKEIIISVSNEQSRIAIVEDGELVELYVEDPENIRTIGDIYLARIRRIKPETRAAFVDIGQDQDAFLHFSDLSENVAALLELAEGRIQAPASRELAREPADGAELEAETPEEQLAAQRRRDLKRSSGGRRRGQRKDSEAASEAGPESPEKEPSQKGRRRPATRRTPIAAPPAEGVPPAPAIIPPGTPSEDAASTAKGSPERKKEKEKEKEEEGRPGSQPRRSRSRKPSGRSRKQGATEETAPAAAKPSTKEPRPARTRSGKDTPEEGAERSNRQSRPSVESSKSPEGAAEKDRPAGSPEPEVESPSVPRLSPSSRFRIDLTAGPPSSARHREEEEEEEERSNTRRSSRRQSRSGRGQRGRSAGGSSKRGNGNQGTPDQAQAKAGTNGMPPEKHLRDGQRILVKITKEPISTKGPRVSTDVSLAGRFLVLVPAADYVAVSKKIESAKERRRLRALARSLLPEGLGLIVRTVAEGRDAKALDADLQLLLEKWRTIEDQLRKRPQPPVKLYEDVSMVSSIIRDLFTEDYERIVIDDPKLYKSVKSYVQAVAPHMADSVQLHRKKESVFRANNIEKDIRAAFETRVGLPGGGSLIIEHTEAMHVIDVNSGRAGRGLTQEQNALKVNLEAAREIAKQLRLRDLGGIICVDFIDMRSNAYRKKLYDELKRTFRKDRAVTKLLPMSDFGVVEITRQRLRPSITTTLDAEDIGAAEEIEEEAPEAPRAARREPARAASEVVADLERWLMHYRDEVSEPHRKRPIQVRVHPFLAAYLQRGIPSLLTRWRLRARLKLKLDVDEGVDPLSFTVRDEKSGKNLTRKYDPQRRDG